MKAVVTIRNEGQDSPISIDLGEDLKIVVDVE